MRCHYAVLGVARGATEEDIRKAYRRSSSRSTPTRPSSAARTRKSDRGLPRGAGRHEC